MDKLTNAIKLRDVLALPLQFTELSDVYKLDHRAKNSINSILDTKFIAVYREEMVYDGAQWSIKYGLTLDGEGFYIVTSNWNLVFFTNSEWASFLKI